MGARPAGCEETELAIRLRRARRQGRIVHSSRAQVEHEVAGQRVHLPYFVARCWAEGLSKAAVEASVGRDSALESERRYVVHTLPAGVARGFAEARRGVPGGLARAGAIGLGLSVTVCGYLAGRGRRNLAGSWAPGAACRGRPGAGMSRWRNPQPTQAQPSLPRVWCGVFDVDGVGVQDPSPDMKGDTFDAARLLVRVHGEPVGFVQVPLDEGRLDALVVMDAVERELGAAVAAPPQVGGREWVAATRATPVSVIVCTRDRSATARALPRGAAPPGALRARDHRRRQRAPRRRHGAPGRDAGPGRSPPAVRARGPPRAVARPQPRRGRGPLRAAGLHRRRRACRSALGGRPGARLCARSARWPA